MTKFLTVSAILALGVLVTDWARASELDSADYGCASAVSERDHELCGDAAYEAASEAVLAAPEWCEVTYVEQDVTHGWRAVCVLVSDGGAS